MSTPETPPPGGGDAGRGLSGVQRAGVILGALAVLLIVFLVLRGGGSDNSSSTTSVAQTQPATTTAATTDDNGGGGEAGDDSGGGGGGGSGGGGGGGRGGGEDSGASDDSGGSSAPAVQTVNVVNGQPEGGVQRLTFKKGDQVRFKVVSDVADEIHVHGYDIKKDVEKGGSVSFSFPASIEGRFEVELEDAGTQIADLEVDPS